MRRIAFATLLVLAIALLVAPAFALKVYVNPSNQTANLSPDGTYNECTAMQDVANRLMAKLANRGIAARNSQMLTLAGACSDAVAWGADTFVALHTNAYGTGWTTPHGTDGFYYSTKGGSYDPRDLDLSERCVHKCVEKFGAWGCGYDRGSHADYPYYGYNLYVLANTPGMNRCLVEGLFHTNQADVAVLKSDTGKDAYATAIYEAVCEFWGWNPYPTALDIIVDNADGDFTCSRKWSTATAADQYGANYRYVSCGSTNDPATWTPSVPVAGSYEVFAWWSAGANRCASAAYTVNYDGGSATVNVNQQATGGQWVSLGTYSFAAGTAGSIKLSSVGPRGSIVAADAIKLEVR